MLTYIYIFFLTLLNVHEFKKLEKIDNSSLFYILSLDVLSLTLYIFYYVYNSLSVSLINTMSILITLYFYNKEKYNLLKIILFFINIFILIKILF